MTAIDSRLTSAGMNYTLTTLVTVFADHTPPAPPVPDICRACGHSYLTDGPLCASAAIVRPLILRRRREARAQALLSVLTIAQEMDLYGPHLSTAIANRTPIWLPDLATQQLSLFPTAGGNR